MIQLIRTVQDVFETPNCPCLLVYVVQPRNLYQPTDIMREQPVRDDPFGELVPLISLATVYADPPLAVLVGERRGQFDSVN